MSSSDVRMLEELTARVAALEAKIELLGEQFAALLPKPMGDTLYGAEPDHAADREARAALVRRPPRA